MCVRFAARRISSRPNSRYADNGTRMPCLKRKRREHGPLTSGPNPVQKSGTTSPPDPCGAVAPRPESSSIACVICAVTGIFTVCGRNSVGRMPASQAGRRRFESGRPLCDKPKPCNELCCRASCLILRALSAGTPRVHRGTPLCVEPGGRSEPLPIGFPDAH